MSTRDVLVDLQQAVGSNDWSGAVVSFALQTSISVLSNEVYPQYSSSVTTGPDGTGAVVLTTPDSDAWQYLCTLPSGQNFLFNLEAGSDIYLSAIIADANLDASENPGDIQEAVDAHVALSDPHAQYLEKAGDTWTGEQVAADNLLTRPVIKDYGETHNAIGAIGGGTQDIDLELGNSVSGTIDTSTTTFTFSNPPASGTEGSFAFYLTNGGSETVNWPSSVDWAGGTAPSLTTAGIDILIFTTVDGGAIWYGFAAGLDMK